MLKERVIWHRKHLKHYRFKCAIVSKNLARSTEQALEFITNHQSDPDKWTAQKIADDYKMKPKLVEHILHHFKTYNVFIADQNSKQTLLTQTKRKLLNDKPKSQS
uniref:Uncharacterized protein n=1 Tax=Glossina morsitans morsitans TaxID=37546 RepID=A0A1B0FMZ7_GLOMM